MRKALILLASTALIGTGALSAEARNRDRADRPEQTVNQMVNIAAAQTARIKVDLHLTTEQEKNWPAFETAMRDMSKRRIDRAMAMREQRSPADASAADRSAADKAAADRPASDKATSDAAAADRAPRDLNLLERINRSADARIEQANDWKALSTAAKPLYDSLDEQQKRRFAEILLRGNGGDGDRSGRRERSRDRDGYQDERYDAYPDRWRD